MRESSGDAEKSELHKVASGNWFRTRDGANTKFAVLPADHNQCSCNATRLFRVILFFYMR